MLGLDLDQVFELFTGARELIDRARLPDACVLTDRGRALEVLRFSA